MPETHAAVDVRSATPTKQLVIERILKASPERVFDAFTDPEQLMKWWWPNGFTCPAAEVDLRVGGRYRLAMEWPGSIPSEAQFSHQAVATALLVALACLLVRSFDRGSPASARRRDSRRTAAETPKVSVATSTRPTPSA